MDSSTERARPRVLIVDDEDLVRRVTIRTLEEAGYETVAAIDGQAALDLIRATPAGWFDVVLTNSIMPAMNGKALVRQVRARDPAQRFIHMTGHPNVTFEDEPDLADSVPELRKPFTPEALLACIEQLLHGREGESR